MFSKLPPSMLLTLSALFWGGNFVVGRWAHSEIGPISLTFWRWLIAALILMPFVAGDLWRLRGEIRKHFALIFALSVLGVAMFNAFMYLALATTTAVNATFVLASMPMVIPVVSFVMGEERLNLRQGAGILISVVGVGVIISRGQWQVFSNLAFTAGDLWVLAGVLAWSIYSVLLRRKPATVPPLALLGSTIILGVMLLAPFYVWEYQNVGGFALTTSNALVIGYVAFFSSIVAFMCWGAGVAKVGANKAGLFIHLIPLFASVLSIVFLNESLKTYHVIGIAPILLGIYLTTTSIQNQKVS
ncbi:MAG: EamA family transporter [Rhodospirillaceae bacterium]|nr:MAG: EamA family transporter [Rhodospirillaceae bacterium]